MATRSRALHDLLCALFTNDPAALSRHIGLEFGENFGAALPPPTVGLSQLAFAVQNLVSQHDVHRRLFEGLRAARPAQAGTIDPVAAQFLDSWHPAPPTAPAFVNAPRHAPAGIPEFTWLHISDIHCKAGDIYDADLVLGALVDFVKCERPHRAPDVIIATGDLAFSGQADEYTNVTRFFLALLRAAGLADRRERLVVVPGNHDVDRRAARGLTRTLIDEDESQDYFGPDHRRPHFAKQAAYRAWHDSFFVGIGRVVPVDSTCGPLIHLAIREGVTVAVLPINTALFAAGADDHNKLWVGRRALREPARSLRRTPATLTFAAMHHPAEWLADAERTQIRRTLRETSDILLTGHLHEADASRVVHANADTLHIAAGAAYQGSLRPCRVFYGALDGPTIRLSPYTYADNIERWVLDTSIFPDDPDHQGTFPRPRRRADGA